MGCIVALDTSWQLLTEFYVTAEIFISGRSYQALSDCTPFESAILEFHADRSDLVVN
jgi:hypothetical protein